MSISKNFFHNCSGNSFSRDYSRGKSFSFSKWSPAITYTNDIFKQDFVNYNGNLYACVKTNTNESPEKSDCWYLVVDKIPSTTLFPEIDSDGNISWRERVGDELPETVNIRGPKGDCDTEELIEKINEWDWFYA